MPALCDEDGYDAPHKDQLKILVGGLLHMLRYQVYYHDKNLEVWLTEPQLLQKMQMQNLSETFFKMAAIMLSNFNDHNLDDNLHLNTK